MIKIDVYRGGGADVFVRSTQEDPQITVSVAAIVADVAKRGDEAVREYSLKFDGCAPEDFLVSEREWEEGAAQCDPYLLEVMKEAGIDISDHVPTHVNTYLNQEWDYVITVCGGANESCPAFTGKVGKRLHIGFDDPSHAVGTPEFIDAEFHRVRDEIKKRFAEFYVKEIKMQELPKCSCGCND